MKHRKAAKPEKQYVNPGTPINGHNVLLVKDGSELKKYWMNIFPNARLNLSYRFRDLPLRSPYKGDERKQIHEIAY